MMTIQTAVDLIKNGGVVSFPTETVYGLGADATNYSACKKIYDIKQRPSINPLIVHVSSIDMAMMFCSFNREALMLAHTFWPGPLSIVLPISNPGFIASNVVAGLSTVAVRIPRHEVALRLIRDVGVPIAAPSANISGMISPTTYSHVTKQFPDILSLDGGQASCGLESTVISLSNTPIILRHGAITKSQLEDVLGVSVNEADGKTNISSPGMMSRHYATHTRIRMNASVMHDQEVGLDFGASTLRGGFVMNLSNIGDLVEASRNLYHMLRTLDEYAMQYNKSSVAIVSIPNVGLGVAINDRLKRASIEDAYE